MTQAADYPPLDEGNSNRLDGKAFRMDENEGLGSFDADYRRLLARSPSPLMLISALLGVLLLHSFRLAHVYCLLKVLLSLSLLVMSFS